MPICKRCLAELPDSEFPLGEKICRECKRKAARDRRARTKEASRQLDLIFKQVKEG